MAAKAPGRWKNWAMPLSALFGSAFFTFFIFESGAFEPGESEVKAAVVGQMRDPDSAQFRNIYGSDGIFCGEVNGKNSFGGYVGFQPFVYRDGEVTFGPTEPIIADASMSAEYAAEAEQFDQLWSECN